MRKITLEFYLRYGDWFTAHLVHIQLLLLVYGQHINHSAKTQNKYVGSCSLFLKHVPFYMYNNMLCLTAMTDMFMDTTHKILLLWYHYPVWQWPPDIKISVGVIKAYFIKASIIKKTLTDFYVSCKCTVWAKRALNVKPDGTHNKPLSFKG
jgi:hypothetical protein